jgi:hypothetical protein
VAVTATSPRLIFRVISVDGTPGAAGGGGARGGHIGPKTAYQMVYHTYTLYRFLGYKSILKPFFF